jgi:hypothetical protein
MGWQRITNFAIVEFVEFHLAVRPFRVGVRGSPSALQGEVSLWHGPSYTGALVATENSEG